MNWAWCNRRKTLLFDVLKIACGKSPSFASETKNSKESSPRRPESESVRK